MSGLITFGLTYVNEEVRAWWAHPFAYNAFVLLVSFVLTFRCVGVGWLHLSTTGNARDKCQLEDSVCFGGWGGLMCVGMLTA